MNSEASESVAMRIAGLLQLRRIRWSLRRLYIPVSHSSLVLEVGSGGNPYPRSNVLLDAYEETRERFWDPLVHDRPTILAFGENLPFKDKVFDFAIAAHVLEHTPDPDKFLSELQRVAHAGYIETPDAFMERINPYKDHRLEVTVRNNCLLIRKKASWIVDKELVELYEHRAKHCITREMIPKHPSDFHVRYYWKDQINFCVVNPEVDASWKPEAVVRPLKIERGLRGVLRGKGLKICRQVFSQNRRNKALDILPLLRCPKCHGEAILRQQSEIVSKYCGNRFSVKGNVCIRSPIDPPKDEH